MTDPQNPQQPPAYETPAYPDAPPAAPAYNAGAYGAAPGAPIPGRTMGIVAFILSFFLQLVALVLGIVALVQSKKAGHKNGFALAAIIISSVLIVVGTIVAIILFTFFANVAGDLSTQLEACIANGGTGTVEVNGVTFTCEQLLEQAGR